MEIGTVLLDHLVENVMIVLYRKIEGQPIKREMLKLDRKSILGRRVEMIRCKKEVISCSEEVVSHNREVINRCEKVIKPKLDVTSGIIKYYRNS